MEFLYFKLYKPYGMLSQFTDENDQPGLGHILDLPKDVYPVGRLDKDSEGLLLLTNNNRLKHQLLNPGSGHPKEYWVQVDGEITDEAIVQLQRPMTLNYKGKKLLTKPAEARKIPIPQLPDRNPPIRVRKHIPTSWIALTITEGKNRQIRKMTAAVGFPALRLIRVGFGSISLGVLRPGQCLPLANPEVKELLK